MNGYEIINLLEQSQIDALIAKGLLRATVKRDKEIYEHYLKECAKGICRMQARANTADKFRISERRVSEIKQRMK